VARENWLAANDQEDQEGVPPGASKHKEVRYVDIHEGEEFDELATWVKQAAALPGWIP
jgi:hypothetical protein